jgi:uncharacterized protein involved in exopolysaccharide biosynthesis
LRYRLTFLLTSVVLFGAGVVLISLLPNVYNSNAKIMIERPNTYDVAGAPNVRDNLSQRMHAIIASVMSTRNIRSIVSEYGLAEDVSPEALHDAVEGFRDSAEVTFDNVAVINQYTGKSGMFSQGLLVDFRHRDPDMALQIAERLTNDILAANAGKGEQSQQFRNDFLSSESKNVADQLAAVERKVASFKQENALFLPELHSVAIRRLDEIANNIARGEESVARIRRELNNTEADLATASTDSLLYAADGTRILGVDERLRLLEIEYATKSSRYSKEHPEVARLAKELKALRQHVKSNDTAGIEVELREIRQQLSAAQERYTNAHPDVVRLSNRAAALEEQLGNARQNNKPRSTSAPTNPAYNRFLVRQSALKDDLARERQKLRVLQEDRQQVQDQLARMPAVEQQLAELEREHKSFQTRYQEVEAQLANAKLSAGMRNADLLEKFVLIEAPERALKPSSPKKSLLLPVLFVLAVASGLFAAILRGLLQNKIWTSEDIEEVLDAPVLLVPRLN